MEMWRFLKDDADLSQALQATYDYRLIFLSCFVMIAAAYTGLEVVRRIRVIEAIGARRAWLAIGAFIMGSGVWSMHFIGMLALELPIAVNYSIYVTLLSVLPAIFASAIALRVMCQDSVNCKLADW